MQAKSSYVAPRTAAEETLISIWKDIIGLQHAGVHDNFFELGGHSLSATRVVSRIRQAFQIELPLRRLFECPTIAELAEHIETLLRSDGRQPIPSIKPRARTGTQSLSFAQERLWFINQLQPDSPAYNIPFAFRLNGALQIAALEKALNELVRRHESLRTTFISENGQPRQVIAETLTLSLAITDLNDITEAEAEAQRLCTEAARRPFDLSKGPLVRASLLRFDDASHILILNLHHLISDGWSTEILFRELAALYESACDPATEKTPLAPLTVQYADYSLWQRDWLRGKVLEQQLAYWKDQLKGIPEKLPLPTDRPRPANPSYCGGHVGFTIPKTITDSLQQLSRQEDVTLFMTLLAAFKILLFRYSNQEDIVVGAPIANRNRAEIEGLIGFFVNTLVLRSNLSSKESPTGNPSFTTLLAHVKETCLQAFAHQDLPFDKLVEELHPERYTTHQPLFQVIFQLLHISRFDLKLPGLTIRPFPFTNNTAKFDLNLTFIEQQGALSGSLEYSSDLFDAATIERMVGHFQTLLQGIVANPQQPIDTLPMLTESEQQQLLVEWNNTQTDYPNDQCIHRLFEKQVEQNPNAVSICFENKELTYRELNQQANRLAHDLRTLGIATETLVGVCMERSPEMIVALLGILKAGATYVPMDPGYPRERLDFMFRDSDIPLLLTQEEFLSRLPAYQGRLVLLNSFEDQLASEYADNWDEDQTTADNLAYVMYTSGSTGMPKGICVTHRAINRLIFNTNYVRIASTDRIAHTSNVSFDAATFEMWGALLHGARLTIIPKEVALSPAEFAAALRHHQVSILFITTALFNQVVREQPHAFATLNYVLFGGEAVDPHWVRTVLKIAPPKNLVHVYGPTENTTFSTYFPVRDVPEQATTVPIGRPISNTQLYLLDHHLQPVAIGVAGEIYLGGDGLARGYLNRPELTNEKFVTHTLPFSPHASRLYKTGDLARSLPDGNIEFLGRVDHQVKLRGFRIELGEIEAALKTHTMIKDAVVTIREDQPGEKSLTAYLTENRHDATLAEWYREAQAAFISQWLTLYENTYDQPPEAQEAEFNTSGWMSSYTNQPIPAAEMQEWVDDSVNSIMSFQPQHVLEIGCGTGLLLYRIAPHCSDYVGTDFSEVAVDNLRQRLGQRLPQVKLLHGLADNFTGIAQGHFDMAILNSLVQYFPSIEYLLNVLAGTIKSMAPGGKIFIGDIRSLPLLEAFHTSVALEQASDPHRIASLRQQVQQRVRQDKELVIDSAFFTALQSRFPEIRHVEFRLKQGRYHNELTRFRYAAILHIGNEVTIAEDAEELNWQSEGLTLPALRQQLTAAPTQLYLSHIPNARIEQTLKAVEAIHQNGHLKTVRELRRALSASATHGIDPQAITELGKEFGYEVSLVGAEIFADGCFSAWLRRKEGLSDLPELPPSPQQIPPIKPWFQYANNPLQANVSPQVIRHVRDYLKQKLPDYMIPSQFMALPGHTGFPLTPSGKIDRLALPQPNRERPELSSQFVAPRSPVEEMLAGIWAEVLDLEQIGVLDDFFDLGGHSLKATQIVSRIEDTFQVNVPLRKIFETPTVSDLALEITQNLIDVIGEDEADRIINGANNRAR